MARSIQEIQNEIIAEKNATASLQGLNSDSATAIWKLWTYIIASSIWLLEKMWDAYRVEVDQIKSQAIVGTPGWYVAKAKEFQYGDAVTVDPVTWQPKYAAIDAEKQIIKRVAITSAAGVSVLKVAKEGEGNIPQPLSTDELNAFTSYIRDYIQFAGAQISITNNMADRLYMKAEVFYDPVVAEPEVRTKVIEAIENYIVNLPFDGRLTRNGIIDAVRAIVYKNDIFIEDLKAKSEEATTYTEIKHTYQSVSGYLRIDPDIDLNLDDFLKLTPNE